MKAFIEHGYDWWRYQTKRFRFIADQHFYMREPLRVDQKNWLKIRNDNFNFLQRFEYQWQEYPLRKKNFIRYYEKVKQEEKAFAGRYWLIFLPNHQMVGAINYFHMRYGMYQSAEMGYWLSEEYSNKKIMRRAIFLTLEDIKIRGIRRVEAYCLPTNIPSTKVLAVNDFQKEGVMREKLKINGYWKNHELWAKIL